MKRKGVLLCVILLSLLAWSCNPEDEYLGQLYSQTSRANAISGLIKMKGQIKNKEKTVKKLLNLNKTPDIATAVLAVGEIGYAGAIPRLGEIAEECFKTPNVRNFKTLEAIATAIGKIQDPAGIPILEKYFSIDTPEQLAPGQREKPESVAKRAAAEALSKMPEHGKKYVPELIKLLESPKEDFGTKYTIAGTIGEFGDPAAVKPLVTALFYEEQGYPLFPEARKSLIRLGKFAEEELVKAYNGQNPQVNKILADNKDRALKQMCPNYLGKDIEKLKKEGGDCSQHDQLMNTFASIDAVAKIKTSWILADIRSEKAVETILAELESQLKVQEKQPFLVENLSVQLAKMGDYRATDTFLKMVSKDFALKAAKGKEAEFAKKGQEISIRMKGSESLAILGDKKALPYLLKAFKEKELSEKNVQGETIIFYEPKVWAGDAYTRITDDPAGSDEFIVSAKEFLESGKKYIASVEEKAQKSVEAKNKDKPLDESSKKKQIESEARLDPNYASTQMAVKMVERFIKRAETAKECKADIACYAAKLGDKDPIVVEKAVYMIGFAGKLSEYKDKIAPLFLHPEPFVRDALSIALLRTSDKAFIGMIEDAYKKEGDKVEFSKSTQEFKAIASYLKSFK